MNRAFATILRITLLAGWGAAAGCRSLPPASANSTTPWLPSSFAGYDDVVSAPPSAPAPSVPPEPLTLDRLLVHAVTANPALQQRLQQARQSEARMRQAVSAWYPSVDLAASGRANSSDALTEAGRITTTAYGPSASLSWLLLDFGVRSATVQAGLLEALAANHQFNQAFQDTLLEVHAAYYDWSGAQAVITASETNLANAAATLETATFKEARGLGTRLDALRARTDVEQSRSALESALAAGAAAQSRLAVAAGWPAMTPLAVEAPRTVLPEEPDWSPEHVANLIEQALAGRPDVVAARLSAQATDEQLRATRAEWYPRLTGEAQAGQTDYRYSGNDLADRDVTEYSAGLALTFNVFDGQLTANRIRAADEARREAQLRVQEIELAAGKTVWDRYHEYRSALRQAGYTRAALDSAEEAFRMTDERYRSGLCDIVFLLDAQNSLSRARLTWVTATHNALIARVRLIHATGNLGLDEP